MKPHKLLFCFLWLALGACTSGPLPSLAETSAAPLPTTLAVALSPAAALATSGVPGEGTPAPASVAAINPLTGLQVEDAAVLDRRPLIIKVENLPREHRPQWGLNQADHVYEYYTEEGSTRFAAVFYGQEAGQVGPIRSARFFDIQLMQMYKGIFIFGSAYEDLLTALFSSDFSSRLLLEEPDSCPAICRYDPNETNLLMANTTALRPYIQERGIDDSGQNLSGLAFSPQPPENLQNAPQIYVRYSAAIYNRWDYDPASNRYLRFSDADNDLTWENEVYAQLTDKLSGEPVSADNLVILYANYVEVVKTEESEVYDIDLNGDGNAYVARDGKIYAAHWQRPKMDDLVTLTTEDGQPFPLKPGRTWFEVIGLSSRIKQEGETWRFTFYIP
ncbi:MAG: DUF3048 domain-containing protein [Chloroflexi bacterium]|nr:DUF3048 domain-containing protein [Anaerolineaceae bacterium]NMB87306.1 DUF3048 domain-containing protein [Chloroflexota bacterium]